MSLTLALSVDVATVAGAWIAALAIVALVLTGWRQPARAQPRTRRGEVDPARRRTPAVEVEHGTGEPYRPSGPIRRTLDAVAAVGLSVLTGAVIAIVVSFAVALTVIRVTGLLAE